MLTEVPPRRSRRRRRRKHTAAPTAAHLGYRFEKIDGHLALRRVLVRGHLEAPLEGPLAQLSAAADATDLMVTDLDRRVDALLGAYAGGPIPPRLVAPLLDALAGVGDLGYRGRPMRTAKPTTGLCVRVEACGRGVRLRLDKDPLVDELFANGALRRGIKLRAVEPHRLGERRFAELRTGQIFEERDYGTLVGDVLPKLQLELPVVYDTDKLPRPAPLEPHLEVASSRDGDGLTLLATLTYGDPPRARLEGERLVLLGGGPAPVRDLERERPLIQISDELGLALNFKRTFYGTQAIAAARRLNAVRGVWITGLAHFEFYDAGPIAPRLEVKDDGDFELWFAPVGLSAGAGADAGPGTRADAAAVLGAWERHEPLVPLFGGGFSRLPEDWLQRYGHRVRDLLAAREALRRDEGAALGATVGPSQAARYLLPDLAALAEALNQPPPPSFKRLRKLLGDFAGIPKARLSAKLDATLRTYQRRGVDWLSFLRDAELGALLADDMGLGKTLQTLAVIKGRTLVVAPTSVLHNWQAEAARFRPSLSVHVYHGPDRQLDPKATLTLTTYALLRLDAERLAAEDWEMVVLDEAQAIKNPTSQVAKAAYALPARFRVALTGTPVENRLEDLWSQFHFLNRGLLGGRHDFHERYVKAIAAGDPDAAERLRQRIRPFVLRRLKSEVAKELPPRTEVVLHCELGAAERELYDAVRAATRADVVKKLSASSANTFAVLEALLRLRQAACHPALLPGQAERKGQSSAKLDLLLELLGEALAEGHKALVFSQWTSLLDLTAARLGEAQISFTRLDGRTRNRKKVVSGFQSADGPPVMLVSLKAGGTGLNLTAADHVVLLDPWWNPAVEDQAADRTHRIGQKHPVLVHRLVAKDTVEDRILELQQKKRALADAALARGKAGQSITREELLALLD